MSKNHQPKEFIMVTVIQLQINKLNQNKMIRLPHKILEKSKHSEEGRISKARENQTIHSSVQQRAPKIRDFRIDKLSTLFPKAS